MECMRGDFVKGRVLHGRFVTISPLNHGSFGMVFVARDNRTGSLVAIKCLTKTCAASACQSGFAVDDRSEELAIHARIGYHRNIVNLICSFDTSTHVYLVLEFCSNGDLYEAIRLGKGPKETEHVRDFMLQLVDAVQHIHHRGIYHRDIKPENIFLDQAGCLKLGDFGLATKDSWSFESAVGSDRYMAPEQYDPQGNGYAPAKADIWAIGICLLNVLFSRNPFATPTTSDPLYTDFCNDRQSLFDVFPNMSQDTFEVLVHCLAVDPSRRSLDAAKQALARAVTFTTDDESLDDFCTDSRNVVPASANRQPLRTPSVTSPNLEGSGPFQWAQALHKTLPQPIRRLSSIQDVDQNSDNLFPGSEQSRHHWYPTKPDNASITSVVDSGLGGSLNSMEIAGPQSPSATRHRPVAIANSVPAGISRVGKTLSSIFGKRDQVSKSWSELWDEEEEAHASVDGAHIRGNDDDGWSSDESDDGLSTPRVGLCEAKSSFAGNGRSGSPAVKQSVDDGVSEHTGFVFEDHPHTPPGHSPGAKRSDGRKRPDKWTVLGQRRRGVDLSITSRDQTLTPPSSGLKQRLSSSSWKKNFGFGAVGNNTEAKKKDAKDHGVWEKKEWSLSTDWRKSDQNLARTPQQPHHRTAQRSPTRVEHPGKNRPGGANRGDAEWVGGFDRLHL